MTEGDEEYKNDLLELRDQVKEIRLNLTDGIVESKARALGKTIEEFGEDLYDKLDSNFSRILKKFISRHSQFSDKVDQNQVKNKNDLETLLREIRAKRREITGGHLEDNTRDMLQKTEDKLDRMAQKIVEVMELDSDLDLIRDLK
jgi:hypothetical protein